MNQHYIQSLSLPGGRIGAELKLAREGLVAAAQGVGKWRADGLPHFRLPAERSDRDQIEFLARSLCFDACDLVIFGIGGSSLGAQALGQLRGWGTPAYRPEPERPAIHIVENLDGGTLQGLMARLNLSRTKVLAVSKSGSTTETLAQTLIAIAAFEQAGLSLKLNTHLAVVAEPGDSPMRKLAAAIGCPAYDHDPKLGGRYSVLSLVGLVPAACFGLDIAAIRAGASDVLAQMDALDAPFAEGAALSVAAARVGLGSQVMWAYADRLERFVMWWRQLWGESVGKGGQGTTPLRALGPVDQHSQLQLYLDGPADKLFTVITVDGDGPEVPSDWANKLGLRVLGGKTPSQIVAAQARATVETLVRAGRPVRTIHLPRMNEQAIGALMMHFMLETLYAAQLIGVDPFDQPAVELGKVLTRQYLSEGST